MGMIDEMFGIEVYQKTLPEVKKMLKKLPKSQNERRYYMLHEWNLQNNKQANYRDYKDVEV